MLQSSPPLSNNEVTLSHRAVPWFSVNLECPLLEAMPFPDGVSHRLEEVQQLVGVAIDDTQPLDARAEAFQSLKRGLILSGITEEENLRVRFALCKQMMRTGKSARFTLLRIELYVEECECKIITVTSKSRQPCPPIIEYSGSTTKKSRISSEFLRLSEELLTGFAQRSLRELKRLGAHECTACITVLILYLQHWSENNGSAYDSTGQALTSTAALSLWHRLVAAIPQQFKKDTAEFSTLHGQRAMNTVMHRIGIHLPSPTVEDDNIDHGDKLGNQQTSILLATADCTHVVVPDEIPPASESDARDTIKRLKKLKSPLPVVKIPSIDVLESIREKLLGEFPWAFDAVDAIMGELVTRRLFGAIELTFSPLLLLGPPGVGKTRLVRRVAEELQIPFMAVSLAGMDDSRTLLGTARGWSTAQPAPLVEFLSSRSSASALMLIDEIDKATGRVSNSTSPTTALLSFLEPENSRNFYDAFLQTRVDLSKVSFMTTANSVDNIPGPLISRLRICVVGRPTALQMADTTGFAAADVAKDWGLNPQVFPTVRLTDLDATPINMRHLKLLVKKYLAQWAAENLQRARLH